MDDQLTTPKKWQRAIQQRDEEIESLRAQLEEAKETLAAIQGGAVDALVIDTPQGQRIFTLEGAEHSYRALVEQMGEGAVTLNADGTIYYCNQAFAELLKLPLEQIVGTPVQHYVAPADQPTFADLLRRGLAGTARGEVAFQAADGSAVPVQVGFSLLADGGPVAAAALVVINLSERKQTESLLANEQFIRRVIDHSPIGVAVVGRDLRYIMANPAYQAIAGHGAASLAGRSITEVFPPAVARIVEPAVQQALQSGQPMEFYECDIPLRGRTWWDVTEIPLHDAAGNTEAVLLLTQEVTERKMAEEGLRESEQRFRTMADAMPQLAWMAHADGYIHWYNRRWYEYTGTTPQQMEGWGWQSVHDPLLLPGMMERWKAALASGEPFDMEFPLRGADGRYRRFLTRAVPLKDDQGRMTQWFGTNTDVEESKRAEETLRESEQRFRIMADGLPLMIWVHDAQGELQFVNQTYCEFFGVTPQHVAGPNWQPLMHPDDAAAYAGEFIACVRDRRPFHAEVRVRRFDGEWRCIESHAQPRFSASGAFLGMVGSSPDITERKQAEEELAAAKTSAEQAKATAESANKAKDHFLAVLSHELRNPLNPVLATASMLHADPRFDADTREQLEIICRNVALEARLIDDLLDVTRIERGKIELDRRPVELGTIIQRALEVCGPDIEARKLTLGIDAPDGPYWVDADAARLQQVLWNLLKNAVKFSPHGGCMGVRCRRDGDALVLVEVSDSGVGIEPAALGRIFNAFEQAERSITQKFGGLGLGLAISKALVDMHGGHIEAHSPGVGKGATFTVRLPLLPTEALVPPLAWTSETLPPAVPPRPLRILLVEDHGDTARVMRRLLSAEGHEVQHAGDLKTALQLATEHAFDLLLSDMGLPDGSGLDLMRALRAKGLKLPGIALSGYGQEQDVKQSLKAGFATHLVKPVSLPKLEEAIAQAAGHGTRIAGGGGTRL